MSWVVASIMTTEVATVSPAATYKEVALLLHERGVSALPVLDAGGRVLGIVSEDDLLVMEERPEAGLAARLFDPHGDVSRVAARSAADLMTAPPVTIGPSATLRQAARLMRHAGVKRLPVVDANGTLLGIVSRSDLLAPFLRSDDSIASEVRGTVLTRELSIDPHEIEVTVEDGVVWLEGKVETRSLARIVERLTAAVEGVVAVDGHLTWTLDDSGIGPDMNPLALRLPAEERE